MPDNNQSNDEIDLKNIFYLILRNKYLITCITIFSFISSAIFALSLKRTWSGNFQIVLKKKESSVLYPTLPENSNLFESLIGGQSSTDLNTQIEILKSPSVLMPIFEYVKVNYKNDGQNIDDIAYKKWFAESFNIDLGKRTQVLNVEYRDKKKDLILPVLRKISKTYKEYSGKTKLQDLNSGIDYLESQIEIYEKKQQSSLRELQDFAYENDLSSFSLKNDESNTGFIETTRVRVASQIRLINNYLKKIEEIPDNSKSLIYFQTVYPEFTTNPIRLKVLEISESLAKANANFIPGDKDIKILENKLNAYIPILKKELINFLESKKYQEEASYKSATIDKETLTKYKQLRSNSLMDEKTLMSLIAEKRKLSLQKAKTSDPWDLITKPTLTKYPVAPSRKRITLIGTFLGILIALLLSLILEQKKGIVFSKTYLEKSLGFPLIKYLNSLEIENWESNIKLLTKSNIFSNKKEYTFLQIGTIDDFLINELRSLFSKTFKDLKILFSKDIIDSLSSTETILLVQLGKLTKQEIEKMNEDLNFQKNNIRGIIYIK